MKAQSFLVYLLLAGALFLGSLLISLAQTEPRQSHPLSEIEMPADTNLDMGGYNVTNIGWLFSDNAHFSGKVGIGTSSPETALDVNGIIKGNYGGGLTAGGTGVTKYYYVGSLPYSSASVYQKLYVIVWGGGWEYYCSGIDEYVISSRGGKIIYATRTKGGATCKYSIKIYDTGSGYDVYVAIIGKDYPNLLIRAFKLDSPDNWIEQRIYEKTPTGTDDTVNWEVRYTITTDASANTHIWKDLYLEKASPTIYVRQNLNIRLDKNYEGDYRLNIQRSDGTTVAYITEAGAIYAPSFYDKDNTGYYVNPYGTSKTRRVIAEVGVKPSPDAVPSITLSDTTDHGPEVYKYTGTINGVSCDSTTRGVIMVAHITNSETGAQDALCFCTLEGSDTYYWTCLQI